MFPAELLEDEAVLVEEEELLFATLEELEDNDVAPIEADDELLEETTTEPEIELLLEEERDEDELLELELEDSLEDGSVDE